MKTLLHDISFLIIIRLDSIIRLENLLITTRFLTENFDTNIFVNEYDKFNKLKPQGVHYEFYQDYDSILFRTRFLNEMVKKAKTPFVSIWDADVIVNHNQIEKAVEYLRKGYDFVYPYTGPFYNTSEELRQIYSETADIKLLENYTPFMEKLYGKNPVGGAFFANKRKYIECGIENEDFYGWGLEDGERFKRFKEQGCSIARVNGPIFHLTHPRGNNSKISSRYIDLEKRRLYYKTTKEII